MRKIWGDLSKAKHPEAVVYLHNSSLSGLHFATKDEVSGVMAGFAKKQAIAFVGWFMSNCISEGKWSDLALGKDNEELYNLFINETRNKG